MAGNPAYLEAFTEYTKILPGLEDQGEMDKEFYGESHRACVILQASWVELIIERNLRTRLRWHGASRLFEANAPLSTFSNKINMAFSMGAFGEKTRHDLNLIRHLRNGFAHCRLPLYFKTPAVKGVCDNLSLPDIEAVRAIPHIISSREIDGGGTWYDRDHPRERYMVCCYSIV